MLNPLLIEKTVRAALEEDLGRRGDITAQAVIPAEARAKAVMRAREGGVTAGLELAALAFMLLDPALNVARAAKDGVTLKKGAPLLKIKGSAWAILGAERTALNFVSHLSGIATAAHAMTEAVSHTKAKITCTRKTTPGLRALEKYAVVMGGGSNHRYGLDDAVLIKDNHIAVAGGVTQAVKKARAFAGHTVKIEVEVDTLEQLRELLKSGADIVMLDNFDIDQLYKAVEMIRGHKTHHGMTIEYSGRATPENAAEIAETGVDYISSGWITHSAPALDIGLDIEF